MKSHAIGLAIFRVLLCSLIIRNMFLYLPLSDALFSSEAFAPIEDYREVLDSLGLGFIEYVFASTFSTKMYLISVSAVAFLFMLGIGKWFTGFILFISLMNLQVRNQYMLDGSDNVIQVTLFWLILAESYTHFSYPYPKFKIEKHKNIGHIRHLFTIALMFQVCIIYLVTGVVKTWCDVWHNGTAIYYVMRLDEFTGSVWNYNLTNSAFFVKFSTYSTLIFEILFPMLVLFRWTKYLILLAGFIFHVGIWVFMKIDVFPWIMVSTYFVFLSDEEYTAICQKYKMFYCLFKQRISPKLKLRFVLAGLCCFISSLKNHAQEGSSTFLNKVDSIISSEMASKKYPVLGIAYIKKGEKTLKIIENNVIGLSNERISNKDLFEIGSISKTFTSLALAQAIVERRISLEDKIGRFLPEIADGPLGDVTVEQLLTHSSGLPTNPKLLDKKSDDPTKKFDKPFLFQSLKKVKLKKGKFRYSNTGFMVLGLVLEAVYQQPYEYVLKYTIDKNNCPTNITTAPDTTMTLIQGHDERNRAVEHWEYNCFSPAGGIYASIDDMGKYLQSMIALAQSDPNKSFLFRPRAPLDEEGVHSIALGWFTKKLSNGDYLIWHNGGTNGFSSYMGFAPTMNVGVVVLANSAIECDEIGKKILNVLIRE